MDIVNLLEIYLNLFSEVFMMLLEFFGGIIIIYGGVTIFYSLFLNRNKKFSTETRVKLGRITSLGLEFYLAAEIVKTVNIRQLEELYIVAAIVILRIIMALVVHWELKLDLKELETTEKKDDKN